MTLPRARLSRPLVLATTAAAALLVAPAALRAQPSDLQEPRQRLRDRYKTPQQNQKLDENVRKWKSEDPDERLEAVTGFGSVQDPKAVEYLLAAASDPDTRIRVKAIDVLGQTQAKEAVPLLVQRLFMRDTDIGTKQRCLASLGKIGDPRATKPILDFLSRDVETPVRGNAIFALGDIGDPTALPALEQIAQNGSDPMLRGLATDAIRRIKEKPAPPVVPPALVDRRREAGGPPQNP
jgi:HEAT repeat protein